MALRFRDLLLHPDTFFRDLAAGPDEYRMPLLIAGTCMVFDAVRQFLLADWMRGALLPLLAGATGMPQLNEILAGAVWILLVVAVVENIPAFIAYWLIIAAVLTIVSGYFSQEGTIYKMVAASGWGMAPLIVYNAVSVPLFLAYRDTMTMTIDPALLNATASRHHRYGASSRMTSEEFRQYVQFNQPFVEHSQAEFALFAISLLCCCIWWTFAVKNIRKIPLYQAAASVVLPAVLFLAALLAMKVMNGWAP
jgi:hypothetical protein